MNGPFDPRVDPQLLDRIIRGKLFDSSQYHDQLNLNGAQVVVAATPANGDVLTYDTPLGQWVNKPIGVLTGVSSVTAANGTLTIAPTVGNVLASLNLGNANTWTALQTFGTNISILGKAFAGAGPSTNQVIAYNGTNWVATSLGGIPGALIGQTSGTPLALTALGAGAAGIASVGGATTVTGALNTYIGFNAGHIATSAANNVGIGAYALQGTTTGGGNTVVGYQSMNTNVTGTNSTAMGYQTLYASTTGPNDAFGYQTLTGVTSGQYNAAFGYQALTNNTTGTGSSAFGYQALFTCITTGNSSAFGYQAGYFDVSGASVMMGYLAGYNNTSGASVIIGWEAGYFNTTGDLVAVGYQAGQRNTSGNSVMIGVNAGFFNTTTHSTMVGYGAGYNNLTGSVAILGFSAGYNNTGGNLTALGYQAGHQNTTADSVMVGYNAGYSNTSGLSVMVGASAGYSNTTGGSVMVGYQAGYSNVGGNVVIVGYSAGYNNTADRASMFGYQAGYSNTTGLIDAFGYQAGYTSSGLNANTTGTHNIYFGYNSGPGTSTQLNYSGAIGSQAVVFASNLIVIGAQNGANGATATVGLATPGGVAVGYTNQGSAPGVGTFVAYGATSGSLTQAFAAVITSYTITWPSAVANGTNYVLVSDATGALSWIAPASVGVSWSSLTNPSTNLSLAMGGFNTTFTNVGTWAYNSSAATSVTTTVNSLNFDILGSFWNGTAAVPYGGRIFWKTDTTGPTGHFSFNVNNNGVISEVAVINQIGQLVVLNTTAYGASQSFLFTNTTNIVALGTDGNKRLQLDPNGSFGGVTTKNNTLDDGSGNLLAAILLRAVTATAYSSAGASVSIMGSFSGGLLTLGTDVNKRLQLDGNGNFGGVTTKNNTLDDGTGIMAAAAALKTEIGIAYSANTNLLQAFSSSLSAITTDANKFLALDPNASFGGLSNTIFGGVAATSVATTKNSNYTEWQGHYWNGSASVLYGGRLQWTQDATTPTGHFSFNLNNNGTLSEIASINQVGALVLQKATSSLTGAIILQVGTTPSTIIDILANGTRFSNYGNAAQNMIMGANLVIGGAGLSFSDTTAGLIAQYKGITTAGWGAPSIYGTVGLGVSLNTTATQVTTYVAGSTGFYSIRIAISCKTSSTVTLTINYTDPQAGTITAQQIYSKALTGGTTDSFNFNMWCSSGATITLNGTDSVALGDAYASAQVEQLQ